MKRPPKTPLNDNTLQAIEIYEGRIKKFPPVLAKGSEASKGLKWVVKDAKREFKYGNI